MTISYHPCRPQTPGLPNKSLSANGSKIVLYKEYLGQGSKLLNLTFKDGEGIRGVNMEP